jgi:hypothetical protein
MHHMHVADAAGRLRCCCYTNSQNFNPGNIHSGVCLGVRCASPHTSHVSSEELCVFSSSISEFTVCSCSCKLSASASRVSIRFRLLAARDWGRSCDRWPVSTCPPVGGSEILILSRVCTDLLDSGRRIRDDRDTVPADAVLKEESACPRRSTARRPFS